jgi:single-stranded DNA-binding protein
MNKIIFTDAVISKGFDGAAALRFNDTKSVVNFKIGKRVYDKNAKDNHRYINIAVKAFGNICERVEKMQLKEGSLINIWGKFDEEQWEDKGQKYSRFIIIAEEIEYASSGKSGGNGSNGSAPPASNENGTESPPTPTEPPNSSGEPTGMPDNFGGFDNFPGGNDFFPSGN